MDMFFSDSEYEIYTESSDAGDHDGTESAYGGHAHSVLSSLDESLGKIDDFLAFQRGFVHGDIVYSVSDPCKQFGRVVKVDMGVDLETSFGELIEGVNSRNLVKLRPFSSGDYVICGNWLGRVCQVFDQLTVLLNDGSKCEILAGDSDNVVLISPSLLEFNGSNPVYHPGQRIRIKHPYISETTRWLCGSWKAGQLEGVICQVKVELVHVKWIASFLFKGCIPSPPDHVQDPEKLTLLSCFPYADWQIGDYCTLPFDFYRNFKLPGEELVRLMVTSHLTKMQQLRAVDQYYQEIYAIVKTRIKVDVQWQNGEISSGLDPEALLPVSNIGEHDFFPGQFVTEASCQDMLRKSGRNLGVVKIVDSQEQIVKVKWITKTEENVYANMENKEETVSAYELIEHPDASYCLGDIVVRLFPNCEIDENFPDLPVGTKGNQKYMSSTAKGATGTSLFLVNDCEKKFVTSDPNNSSRCYTSCIGNVTGFMDENIEVRWANGLISKVHPYEIFSLNRVDEHMAMSVVDQVEENMQGMVEQERTSLRVRDATVFLLIRAAIRFLTNVAERLFRFCGSTNSSYQTKFSYSNCLEKIGKCSISSPSSIDRDSLQLVVGNIDLELNVSELMSTLEVDKMQFDGSDEVENLESEQTRRKGRKQFGQFKHFDIVRGYLDHHFAHDVSKTVKNGWLKRIQQEWNILKKDLPENIFVRIYEEQIDLLRASIIGPHGTPYVNGLFFFDICFPENYPKEPPLVHYRSGGLRLNPNLYESGRVCLSLLNTWTGNENEVWNPESSTILQVLLSLQALVLNDKPYFNEAGYDKQIGRAEAERNSINYNENAFILTCKSMVYILRQPPQHFELLVEEHFKKRAYDILLACKAYMDGVQDESFDSQNGLNEVCRNSSAGFRIMLAKIFPLLVSSLAARGIDCSQFICQASVLPDMISGMDSV
ncbi:putative ubiquitin-conjugating enzyme E2 24 [Apostasia shenzhenica]|uniref:E2 ubiquitin-conjugating enzyme n=1 Tax=Apostasia shenzhenica TaxID=1088818 RepID=A0A2H9ZTJ0_9ASPA|nr:putative ubiquitin-conjugating enzyme E2 24 [Apostasia shenzhenica]